MNTVQVKQSSGLSNYVHKRAEEKLLHSRTKVVIPQRKINHLHMLSDTHTTLTPEYSQNVKRNCDT